MVASQRVCSFIDVNEVSYVLNIDYEREQFPGLVYRIKKPKICILLFRSGKAVATGAKNKEDIETATNPLNEVMMAIGQKIYSAEAVPEDDDVKVKKADEEEAEEVEVEEEK